MNYEENGKLVGFDTELAEAVCAKLGMTPKFQLIEWNYKYLELNSGNIDCIWNGFTWNCADSDDGVQRSEKVDFSVAYMNNEQCVVVKADRLAELNSAAALTGKKVSAEDGSAGEGAAKALAGENATYVGVTAQMNTLTELKSGNVDFVVIDKTMAKTIVGNGDYADLAIADAVEIESEQYAIGFKKGSDLTAKVNGALKELAADGTLAALAEKYGLSNYLVTDFD
jgi:polar amino acid transport system substrate-binding protein